jgi:hypothetical protein
MTDDLEEGEVAETFTTKDVPTKYNEDAIQNEDLRKNGSSISSSYHKVQGPLVVMQLNTLSRQKVRQLEEIIASWEDEEDADEVHPPSEVIYYQVYHD